ncbi:fragment of putative 3-hydroxyacyl-CoA dehydrogenase [Candidatus Sulfopaludibacter sp. SbA3]|nr:fragment of putative 3-hydroxyacyl-CoA dehydrogenase [Candidatus Sulfopaludibacter sp. SbA3]
MATLLAREAGFITEYDVVVREKLAHILSGGRLTGSQTVSEQYLLDLEREAFLSLCGQPKTHDRIQYMLENGKPLRN